jgi:hypothetical protein
MLAVVEAIEDLQELEGSTRPHVMRCDDGLEYVVKFYGGDKAVINEYIG